MTKWLLASLVFSSFVYAGHPAVSATPTEVAAVRDYKMLNVNKQGSTRVQRFIDQVDGHKVLCYFTDTYFTVTAEAGAGGIHCMLIDQ
jgi:hypothetical protein